VAPLVKRDRREGGLREEDRLFAINTRVSSFVSQDSPSPGLYLFNPQLLILLREIFLAPP